MHSASPRHFQRVRELLRSRETKYAIVMLIVSGVAVKWLLDAYTVDKNVDTLGPASFWNSYDSSFAPWPHGEPIPPCTVQPPYYRECELHGVPDLSPVDRNIHTLLNLKVPILDVAVAPFIVVGAIFVLTFVVYSLGSRRGKPTIRKFSTKLETD